MTESSLFPLSEDHRAVREAVRAEGERDRREADRPGWRVDEPEPAGAVPVGEPATEEIPRR